MSLPSSTCLCDITDANNSVISLSEHQLVSSLPSVCNPNFLPFAVQPGILTDSEGWNMGTFGATVLPAASVTQTYVSIIIASRHLLLTSLGPTGCMSCS